MTQKKLTSFKEVRTEKKRVKLTFKKKDGKKLFVYGTKIVKKKPKKELLVEASVPLPEVKRRPVSKICEVEGCRRHLDLIYLGKRVCNKHFEQHCLNEINLRKELKISELKT